MVLENCHQRQPLNPDPHLKLSQKLGELLAIQHTVLAAKVLRRFKAGGNVEGEYKVNGILVDKLVGTVESTMTVCIEKSVMSLVRVEIRSYPVN